MKFYPKFNLWLNEYNLSSNILYLLDKDYIENLLSNSLYSFDVQKIIELTDNNDCKLLFLYIDNLISLANEDEIIVANKKLNHLKDDIKKSFIYFLKSIFSKKYNKMMFVFYLEETLK
jgi:hypothetical protein